MKRRQFTLAHEEAKGSCLSFICTLPTDGTIEVIVRNASEGKTMQQLGGLFGSWETHLMKEWGHSAERIHDWLKASFLARIYVTEPMNEAQEQWVELLAIYQMNGETEKLEKHAKRISLKWCTLKQMKEFMNAIEAHFQDIGQPLPILDKEWRNNRYE